MCASPLRYGPKVKAYRSGSHTGDRRNTPPAGHVSCTGYFFNFSILPVNTAAISEGVKTRRKHFTLKYSGIKSHLQNDNLKDCA